MKENREYLKIQELEELQSQLLLNSKLQKNRNNKGCEQQRLIKIQPQGEDQIEGVKTSA